MDMTIQTPILIVGAGPAGLSAAAQISRMGVPALLLEQENTVGGLLYRAFPDSLRGLASCAGQTALKAKSISAFDREMLPREALTQWAQDCLAGDALTLLTGARVTAVKVKNGAIRKVTAACAQGTVTVEAEVVIDATGQGTVCALCGVPYIPGERETGLSEAPVLRMSLRGADMRSFLRDGIGEKSLEHGKFDRVECLPSFYGDVKLTLHSRVRMRGDRSALEEAELQRHYHRDLEEALDLIRACVPGLSDAVLNHAAPGYLFPGSLHPRGSHVLELEEAMGEGPCPDWVVGRLVAEDEEGNRFHTSIPYGSLTTQEIKNLLLAGRCISVSHETAARIWGIPAAMATGQAAGCAAVLALAEDGRVKKVPVDTLQDCLKSQGMAEPLME